MVSWTELSGPDVLGRSPLPPAPDSLPRPYPTPELVQSSHVGPHSQPGPSVEEGLRGHLRSSGYELSLASARAAALALRLRRV